MKIQSVIQSLIEAIHAIQKMSGISEEIIDEKTVPIGALDGFDSQRGIEVTVVFEASIQADLSTGKNLFVSEDNQRALSIREVAERVIILIAKGDKAK